MTTRANSQTESGSQGNYFLVTPDLAGTHRSGRTRLIEPELELLAVGSLNTPPGNQSADCQINSHAQAEQTGLTAAARETDRLPAQVAGQTDQLGVGGVVQLNVQSDSRRSGIMPLVTSEVDNMERLDNVRNPPSDGQDALDPEVVVMEPSPTMYSENNLPRSVEASRFKAVVVRATGLRTQIQKSFKNMNGIIVEIQEIEKEEEENDEDEYTTKLWKQVSEEYNKLMVNKSAHEDLVAQVRVMCGYMLEGQADLSGSNKVVRDAREALGKIEAAEDGLQKSVKD